MNDNDKYKILEYFESQINNIQQMYKHFDYPDIIDTIEETVYTVRDMMVTIADEFDWDGDDR